MFIIITVIVLSFVVFYNELDVTIPDSAGFFYGGGSLKNEKPRREMLFRSVGTGACSRLRLLKADTQVNLSGKLEQ